MSHNTNNKRLLIGQINGLFGVQGWVKLFSYANPRKNILSYKPWHIEVDGVWTTLEAIKGREQGKTIVAQLKGVNDREVARNYIGTELYIERSQLPKLPEGKYYWDELTNLEVINTNNILLGKISYMVDTGSNSVMVINGDNEHWVPYIEPFLISIDMDKRQILVDWDENF
ncbi:MAG: ribosome maturation factor RimM [Candidatus Thioglobus sp.]|uniref:ribosome maturation factor RimM n=1 Tax=Candidatus Thioglobus sp. TaxID=2026721 RepID=UPI001DE7049D|nr:ribosome maturation factor RimM [Candidatus Thioglobus sp.]MBT3277588.1 ribosome maturation factor RimM [Candidatus Thioglobus sp.]MBT3447549.1 ribosome maturation factor RimM [Candidatus Thioglobus sp.]MBT3745071.1 ribosome maturation factor RimM [Candidatus Thioglobus sp.]MBT4001096.1 ribosome maturation factor RimM [Candidatus Thioglobus sp.]MBT4182215.1 ribosome maturation factor RimM [Candidatus Thioglobus sp.]